MRRMIDFYRLQIHVMRTWQPGTGSRLRRILEERGIPYKETH